MYPKQALRLIKDPVKGVFVPLIVCDLVLDALVRALTSFFFPGTLIRHNYHWNYQLRGADGSCASQFHLRIVLVSRVRQDILIIPLNWFNSYEGCT